MPFETFLYFIAIIGSGVFVGYIVQRLTKGVARRVVLVSLTFAPLIACLALGAAEGCNPLSPKAESLNECYQLNYVFAIVLFFVMPALVRRSRRRLP